MTSCPGRKAEDAAEGWTGIQEGAGEPRSETAEARFPDKGHTLKGWAGGQPWETGRRRWEGKDSAS